ncbi:RES domain-containing protein [Rhodococcus sp. NM-2]|uniref:RES domain-containing protein n=1 Tax=Rhodococcus sp. NM-2 TaxID=3401174 RepID=UPI003AAF08C8
MTQVDHALVATAQGSMWCAHRHGCEVYRVGFAPSPWEWTPWVYATDGRFTGRWDDPDGVWRTLYVGASRLACYLEVLAYARPSAQVIADLDEIVVDDEDAAAFPTVEPGRVPRSWCVPRMAAHGALTGWFAVPGHPETLATLRVGFRSAAIRHGLDDLDGAAIRDGRPRALTQAISKWINTLGGPDGYPITGVEFDSRHGDGLRLWAVYERPGDPVVSPHVTALDQMPVAPDDGDLAGAMRLLGLEWDDT